MTKGSGKLRLGCVARLDKANGKAQLRLDSSNALDNKVS